MDPDRLIELIGGDHDADAVGSEGDLDDGWVDQTTAILKVRAWRVSERDESMSGRLAGQAAIVTGARAGLGRATALALAAEGARGGGGRAHPAAVGRATARHHR